MSKIQIDYLSCDVCETSIIETDAINKRWINASNETTIFFIDKSGKLLEKKFHNLCSKKCFYNLIKEENEKIDDTPSVVNDNVQLELSANQMEF